MQRVFIGLGSNLQQPIDQIVRARNAINNLDKLKEIGFSSLYRSSPMGPQDQPDYINAVMAVNCELPAIVLLRSLHRIENQQGRIRKDNRWGARTLDLDILLYGEEQINIPDLQVPHYGMGERAFVLYPLFEIAPELEIPGFGPISDLIATVPAEGLQKLTS